MAETDTNSHGHVSYFVVKCGSLESLKKCITTERWALRKRAKPPQPQDILEKAHAKGKVIFVFSVNNQHGWHGYCESLYPLKSNASDPEPNETSEINDADEWCHFSVKWITHFQSLSSYGCLPLEKTSLLSLLDETPVNQGRNWQELSQQVGSHMCDLIDQHLTDLYNKKQTMEKKKQEEIKAKESFFTAEENCVGFCEDVSTGWNSIIQKVESELGKVILACPFGSQRYNCSVPESDSDILVIYQAKTVDFLGLDTPQQTIKNSHSAKMDYTILEIQRYCELLCTGDPRFVETVFIEEDSILAFASDSWRTLCGFKRLLLTQECLEKYLREAKGTKGLKQFEKWKKEMTDGQPAPSKLNKLAYILLRLLQSGRDIVKYGCINVYRENGSTEKEELLNARQGHLDVTSMTDLFDKYFNEIEELKSSASFSDAKKAKTALQEWLVEARLQDLGVPTTSSPS